MSQTTGHDPFAELARLIGQESDRQLSGGAGGETLENAFGPDATTEILANMNAYDKRRTCAVLDEVLAIAQEKMRGSQHDPVGNFVPGFLDLDELWGRT